MVNLDKDFFEFIKDNINSDPVKLRLKYSKSQNKDLFDLAITQIESRRKYKDKLKEFISSEKTIFPDKLSGEQSSHEAIASFHSSLVDCGVSLLDMTSGLGIDTLHFAKKCAVVFSIEKEKFKADALVHNLAELSINNVKVFNNDSIEYLKNHEGNFDVIFVDPARRDHNKNKIFNIADCQPDIHSNLSIILSKGKKLIIKASPLLDITQTIKTYPCLKAIRAVGVKDECKEILIEMAGNVSENEFLSLNNDAILCEAINLDNKGNILSKFSVSLDLKDSQESEFSFATAEDIMEGSYLYEPSSMIMKLSPWTSLFQKYPSIKKFAKSSHLFVSNNYFKDFPGRITVIDHIITKKDRKAMKDFPVNIVSRNYPESAEEIRKNLKAKEGYEYFLYASRLDNKPIMILSSRIQ